jgi:hypothetical protein
MFESIVARALWDLVDEVFDMHVLNFEFILLNGSATKKNYAFQCSFICHSLGFMVE